MSGIERSRIPRLQHRNDILRQAGFEVEDVETVFARFKEKYPSTRVLKIQQREVERFQVEVRG